MKEVLMPRPRPTASPPEKMASSPEFMRIVEAWNPKERPIHCSNCFFAKVTGDGVHVPDVECAKGHGAARSFWQLTRASKPSAFRVAADCPDFSSMDSEPNEKAERSA